MNNLIIGIAGGSGSGKTTRTPLITHCSSTTCRS